MTATRRSSRSAISRYSRVSGFQTGHPCQIEEVGDGLEGVVNFVGDEDGVGGQFEQGFVLLLAGELALFGKEPAGGFGADDEGAADRSGGVAHGTVAVGPVDIFQLSVADDGNELILVP